MMNKDYIDVTAYAGEGYKPVIDYESWRVAILRYCEELEIQNLRTMQKHNESDEVFVLLSGNCMLFSGGQGDTIQDIDGIAMQPLQLYNVKKGTWHTHTLDHGATVLIVENQDTSDLNSPTLPLTEEQRRKLMSLGNEAVE
jgi:hypothetical protein